MDGLIRVQANDMDVPDLYDSEKRFDIELGRLSGWPVIESDRERLRAFLRRRRLEGISIRQLLRYIDALKRFVAIKPSFDALEERDLENFLLASAKLKPYTRQKYWYCLKKFFEHLGQGAVFARFHVKFDTGKQRPQEQIWTSDELARLEGAARTLRDRAFIAVMAEAGYRIGEVLGARVRNVQLEDRGAKILVEGKTGWRNPLLVRSAPLLRQLVEGRGPDEPVFAMSYAASRAMLKRLAARAGVQKNVTQQILRTSSCTRDASMLTEPLMRMKYGWTADSKMPKIYVQLAGRDLDDAILRMNGIEPEVARTDFERMKREGVG